MAKINEKVQQETGIEWCVMGFKKNDSLNRRLMLNTYPDEMTSEKGKKLYPLSNWNNKQVLAYIKKERLIQPISYGQANARSSGTDIEDIAFLLWCRENYPNDLKKVIAEFPYCERQLWEYDYKQKEINAESN